ncbi:MAG: VOC family protein [Phycisphaerae bacterium]
MKMEHVGLNVPEPLQAAKWYVQHLGMKIIREAGPPHYAFFLADSAGQSMIEIYHNTAEAVPNYVKQSPLTVHLAFVSDDPHADAERLQEAGADFVEEVGPEGGDHIITLRDPWGVPVQVAKRQNSLY